MKTTGPSSWRRVQTLRSTADGGMPWRSTSSRNSWNSSPPPFAPQRPTPGVAHTKIWHTLLIPRFYAASKRSPDAASLKARHRKAGLRTLLDATGRARLLGPLGDRFRYGGGDTFVENGRDYVVLREVFLGDHTRYRLGGGELHRLVYFAGPHVEGSSEDAGEAEDVVDLVRVVAASGSDDPRLPHRDLGPYLGVGVGHGEDARLGVHTLEVLAGEYVWHREPEEEVGP